MNSLFSTTIIDRKQVAENTLEVSFKRPADFAFKAGQYIQLKVPKLLYSDPTSASRLFSIASSPLDTEKLSVAFRETGSGFKRTLKELPMGSPVTIEGPHGFFTLPENPSNPLVFVAGGIGITPFLSMIRCATEKHFSFPMTLLYANRSKESEAYLTELQEMANRNSNFILKNKYGGIDEQFLRQHVNDVHQCVWYIVGVPDMIASVRNTLSLLGVNESRILFEAFEGY